MAQSYRHLSMAPTTDLGRNHEVIDKDIRQRESMKYGNKALPVDYSSIIPRLNDINYHRAS